MAYRIDELDQQISSNGIITRTSSGNYSARTLTGTSNQIAITNGNGASGNPTFGFDSIINVSTQPLCLYYVNATLSNVSGNAVTDADFYTIVFNTQLFDQGSNFSGGTTFTAPRTQKYLLIARADANVASGSGTNQMELYINTTSMATKGTNTPTRERVTNFYGVNNFITLNCTAIINMTAGDVATVRFLAYNGTLTTSIRGNSGFLATYFAVYALP